MSFTEINHYVPQWYQQRFIRAENAERKYHYLFLKPKIRESAGHKYTERDLWNWGPKKCFFEKNLYTLRFGLAATDVLEKRFFGDIDLHGASAVGFMADYEFKKGATPSVNAICDFMDALKLRTPRGLDWIKSSVRAGAQENILYLMTKLYQMHVTIWIEGIWEVLRCDDSETKFIVSDNPITTYNKKLFPTSSSCAYPHTPGIELLGTHTIFPLGLSRCLVITNLGYVRNPSASQTQTRENPRMFGNNLFDLRKIQTGRQIPEAHVRAINFIIKKSADRYIAAGKEEWLFPEREMKTHMWDKLGDHLFLMPDPRKVTFFQASYVQYKDGSSDGWDEYGRQPIDTLEIIAQREKERATFYKSQADWNSRLGPLPASYHLEHGP